MARFRYARRAEYFREGLHSHPVNTEYLGVSHPFCCERIVVRTKRGLGCSFCLWRMRLWRESSGDYLSRESRTFCSLVARRRATALRNAFRSKQRSLRVERRVSRLLIGRGARRHHLHNGDRVQQPQAETWSSPPPRQVRERVRRRRASAKLAARARAYFFPGKSRPKRKNQYIFLNFVFNARTSIPPNDSRLFPTVHKKNNYA